jgi:hypothetical protein
MGLNLVLTPFLSIFVLYLSGDAMELISSIGDKWHVRASITL